MTATTPSDAPPTPAPPTAIGVSSDGLAPGHGRLSFAYVGGETVVTRCQNHAPFKLLNPKPRGPAAWAYASSFGGGLVAGDRIDLDVEVGPRATAVVTTQASTKVYHRRGDLDAQQHLSATVADDAVLMVLPDPLTCFADAAYRQVQRFDLAPSGSLALLDWLTAGRSASGESWDFWSYDSLNVVEVGGEETLFDSTKLSRESIAAHPGLTVGPHQVVANLYLFGPKLNAGAEALEAWIQTQPIGEQNGVAAAFSPGEADVGGGVLRLAGRSVQAVTERLRERLDFLHPFTGGCPWERKW